jgi:hypothetical protein
MTKPLNWPVRPRCNKQYFPLYWLDLPDTDSFGGGLRNVGAFPIRSTHMLQTASIAENLHQDVSRSFGCFPTIPAMLIQSQAD